MQHVYVASTLPSSSCITPRHRGAICCCVLQRVAMSRNTLTSLCYIPPTHRDRRQHESMEQHNDSYKHTTEKPWYARPHICVAVNWCKLQWIDASCSESMQVAVNWCKLQWIDVSCSGLYWVATSLHVSTSTLPMCLVWKDVGLFCAHKIVSYVHICVHM